MRWNQQALEKIRAITLAVIGALILVAYLTSG